MLTATRRAQAVAVIAALVVLAATPVHAASTFRPAALRAAPGAGDVCLDRSCGGTSPPPGSGGGSGVGAGADGEGISVVVWGTGVRGGGESATSGRRTVRAAPACFYRQTWTGQEYADAWAPGGSFRDLQHHLPPEDTFEPWPGYLEHQDDAEGHWWYPTCDSDRFPDSAAYQAAYAAFRATHDIVYVEASETPPNAQVVPPETLAQIAFEETDLPTGQVQWNPRRAGDGSTFVGIDTWVWLDDPTVQVQVTAEIPGLSATVTSTFDSLRVEAPGAEAVTCTGTPGTAWAAGATQGCAIVFTRSSAREGVKAGQSLPTTTLTATGRWHATWTSTATAGTREVGEPQTTTATAELPVAEIQAVVTR
ncbi:hypothetical protein OMK64_03685 [Cellulomonas fimi]|uniref:hypothetical protein n=1 Tax=Cellulomonas fimi TaxID=1708 RepID=UPI00234C4A4E|nr:hypothetical protein [Cellulomonas fimi]MDC7120632.1 hypothetical protein [Cellulomonas fimi]